MVAPTLTFGRIAKHFPEWLLHFLSPQQLRRCRFFHILDTCYYLFFFYYNDSSVHEVVFHGFIDISLMNNFEKCACWPFVSLDKFLFKYFSQSLFRLFFILLLICNCSFYILYMCPLSDITSAKTLCHSMGSNLTFLIVSFDSY